MLITLYEDTNPISFNQDFDENIILPRNTQLKLLNAFCDREPLVEINGTQDTIYLKANDKVWAGTQVAVPSGSYTARSLMDTLQGLLETISVDNYLQLSINLTNLPSKNFNAGALIFELNALSLHYNQPNIAIFNNAPTGYVVWNEPDTIVQAPVVSIVIEKRNSASTPLVNNFFGISDITNSVPASIDDIRNCVNFKDEELTRTWFSGNGNNQDTSRPDVGKPYGMVNFTLQKTTSTGNNFYVGITNGTPDLSGVVSSDVSDFNNLKGVDLLVYFEGVGGTTDPEGNTLDAGDMLIGSNYSNFWEWIVFTGMIEGDEVAIVLPEDNGTNSGNNPLLYVKENGDWTNQDVDSWNNHELGTTPYNFCFGAEQGTGTNTNNQQQLKDVFMTSKQTYTHMGSMGQYIEVGFSQTLADTIGLSQTSYKEDKTGTPDKAELKFENDKDAETKINGTEPPFVQVNLNNLPVKSYTRRDTRQTDGYKGNTSSRCIANISRFDINGSYNGHLVDTGNNQPLIQLKNAEPLTLSQLNVRLTNVDGSIPQDLKPPFCANIEITEGK